MLARQHQLDNLSNNLANASTDGYRGVRMSFEAVMAQASDGPSAQAFVAPNQAETSTQHGSVRTTGRALDVAIEGEGFFQLEGPDGEKRFSRLGRFGVDETGTLSLDGAPVIGDGGPITGLRAGAHIEKDGSVMNGDQRVGKIRVVRFENPQALQSMGGTLFTSKEEPTPVDTTDLVPRAIEGSNVNAVAAMTELIRVQRAFDSAKAAIESYRQMDRTLNQNVGR